ncbi:transmembrane protein 268 [Betta splendens]|uniref:Transmembrane protein 268 n=1 Tax=Betta splendens TaxID=158456 RepID=A0A6P7NVT5_BETSP|nr:transmembrane protein 268 [Betta splendens]
MEGRDAGPAVEETEVDAALRADKAGPRSQWANGQCVLAMPSRSVLNPRFDLSQCRASLENEGFQVPVCDLEAPLGTALDAPSVRRYLVLNSSLFYFIMTPVMYMVLWCAVFSTLHLYITVSDYWVLCLSVSLVSIFLTTAVIFVLQHKKKELNVNVDVRLIQVNERTVKHKLLVAVADWVQNCRGHMQLYFVYWDMSHCLTALTDTLEERSFVGNETQCKLERKMSHLVLVTEVGAAELEDEPASDERRPLLRREGARDDAPSSRDDARVTANRSLVPGESLLPQDKAFRLLMTYSSAYVKLLVTERLSGPSHYRLRPGRNHCAAAPLCLCQYITNKILR